MKIVAAAYYQQGDVQYFIAFATGLKYIFETLLLLIFKRGNNRTLKPKQLKNDRTTGHTSGGRKPPLGFVTFASAKPTANVLYAPPLYNM